MAIVRVGLTGASGQMGREIQRGLTPRGDEFYYVGGVDRAGGCLESLSALVARNVDVLLDFSSPELFAEALSWCVKHKKPFVSGTTGLGEMQVAELGKASQTIPIVWARNMSLGIALLSRVLAQFSILKEDFDFQIEEFHHRQKKDNPSGTALQLQERLEAAVGKVLAAPLGIRGGGIFGVHKVWAMSKDEIILLEHTAMNRAVFARGALSAVRWVVDKEPGLYSIQDVIGG